VIGSAQARAQILAARERQAARLRDEPVAVNAHMDARMLRRYVALDGSAEQMLRAVQERGILSARGQHRLLRVARTTADLEGSRRTSKRHLAEALAWRAESELATRRAA
jgi:magnesium chelatase family protein